MTRRLFICPPGSLACRFRFPGLPYLHITPSASLALFWLAPALRDAA
jgi:hypothetical protein